VKVPYVADNPTKGGLNSPSDDDVARMVRDGVEAWQPKRGADWPDLMVRIAGSGPPAWALYTAASAALVVILVTAFLIGSALQIGALAPQSIPAHLH
jgi:hypothetical protein